MRYRNSIGTAQTLGTIRKTAQPIRFWTRRGVRRISGALAGYANRRKASESRGENVPSRGRIQTKNSAASTPSATDSEGTEVKYE